jgi:hypothetical protein
MSFYSQFLDALAGERNQTTKRVKDHGALALNLDANSFKAGVDRTTDCEILRLLQDPMASNSSSIWSNVLFHGTVRNARPFMNERLPVVSLQLILLVVHDLRHSLQLTKLILFGKASSIEKPSTGKRPSKAHLWGVKKITAGIIATTATYVSPCSLCS